MNIRSLRFRITAWYAALLAGALVIFGISVYLGLERYLYWNLQRTLDADCHTIATQLLAQHPFKRPTWLETEIEEAYSPEVNSHFIRVIQDGVGPLYISGAPKDGTFEPIAIPLPAADEKDRSRKVVLNGKQQLLVDSLTFVAPDGSKFVVESGAPYQKIEVVLHGLLVTFAIYMPFIVSLALVSGYWLMRRSLRRSMRSPIGRRGSPRRILASVYP